MTEVLITSQYTLVIHKRLERKVEIFANGKQTKSALDWLLLEVLL